MLRNYRTPCSNISTEYSLNRIDLCKQYSPTLFAILSRGFFRIALSEKTAAISTGNCLKVWFERWKRKRTGNQRNAMPASRSSLRFGENHIFSRRVWIQHELYCILIFVKQTDRNSSYCRKENRNQSMDCFWNFAFLVNNSRFTLSISVTSNNTEEICNARINAMNGRVECVEICISSVCIDNILERNCSIW